MTPYFIVVLVWHSCCVKGDLLVILNLIQDLAKKKENILESELCDFCEDVFFTDRFHEKPVCSAL